MTESHELIPNLLKLAAAIPLDTWELMAALRWRKADFLIDWSLEKPLVHQRAALLLMELYSPYKLNWINWAPDRQNAELWGQRTRCPTIDYGRMNDWFSVIAHSNPRNPRAMTTVRMMVSQIQDEIRPCVRPSTMPAQTDASVDWGWLPVRSDDIAGILRFVDSISLKERQLRGILAWLKLDHLIKWELDNGFVRERALLLLLEAYDPLKRKWERQTPHPRRYLYESGELLALGPLRRGEYTSKSGTFAYENLTRWMRSISAGTAYGAIIEMICSIPGDILRKCGLEECCDASVMVTEVAVLVCREFASELLLTDSDPVGYPWPRFEIQIDGALSWLASIECANDSVISVKTISGVRLERAELWSFALDHINAIANGLAWRIASNPPAKRSATRSVASRPAAVIPSGTESDVAQINLRLSGELATEGEALLMGQPKTEMRRRGKSVLVRGHNARQRHGKNHSETKIIWRRPHWSPALLGPVRRQEYTVIYPRTKKPPR